MHALHSFILFIAMIAFSAFIVFIVFTSSTLFSTQKYTKIHKKNTYIFSVPCSQFVLTVIDGVIDGVICLNCF